MNAKLIQILGLVMTVIYGLLVVWVYWAAPKTFSDATTKAKESLTKAASSARVATSLYEIDQRKFKEGLAAFRGERFLAARDLFSRSDPERQDPEVQYYIAYSLYRQGWGRLSNDDELFQKSLEQVRYVKRLDPDYDATDPKLLLKRPVELEQELIEGLQVTASDFNPLKAFRERK